MATGEYINTNERGIEMPIMDSLTITDDDRATLQADGTYQAPFLMAIAGKGEGR